MESQLTKYFKKVTGFIREVYSEPEEFIPLHAPVFGGNEKKYLEKCIDSTFVSSVGAFVDEFEARMAEYTGAAKAVACVNGTSALHLALRMSGVEPETEVITQPLTFVATANAIRYCGADPVFLDVDRDTMGLSPDALRKWLQKNAEVSDSTEKNKVVCINKTTGRRITACVPMHTYGHPCRIDGIVRICEEYHIPLVEDAAESLGSFFGERHTGTFGTVGVLSFNGNKVITTGGGGMLLFRDKEPADRAKHLTTQAKVPHKWEFIHDEIGYNYRMPNVNAALGLAQLEQLPQFLRKKRRIAEQYREFFGDSAHHHQAGQDASITFISEPIQTRSNYWLNTIMLPDKATRDEFLAYTNSHGVMTRPTWHLMNELDMYRTCQSDRLNNARDLADRLVNIPSSVPESI